MEKKLLIAKSILQTFFFAFKFQKGIAILIGLFSSISFFCFMMLDNSTHIVGPGLNFLLISFVSVSTAIILHQPSLKNHLFWWSTLGAFLSSINILYLPSEWAILMYFVSHFIIIGSLHGNKLNNVFKTLLQYVILQFSAPFYSFAFLINKKYWSGENSLKSIIKISKITIIPLIISIIFFSLYSQANEQFYNHFTKPILHFFTWNSNPFQFEQIFIFMIACIFLTPLIMPVIFEKCTMSAIKFPKIIHRIRKKLSIDHNKTLNSISLSQELKIASISLVSLNLLVVIFNLLDIIYVWFDGSEKSPAQLSKFVHDGTNMVIISIAIGAGILLSFFRKNLNFHPKNIRIKQLAYLWLVQNAFLACSTFVRNLHYVQTYGLTSKRLGVVIFIILTLIGLLFTYQKIAEKHHIRYFLDRISLAFYLILIGFSLIDQPTLIIKHAVYFQKDNIDINYLIRQANQRKLMFSKYIDKINQKSDLKIEYQNFKYNYKRTTSWKEWTYIGTQNDKIESYYGIDHKTSMENSMKTVKEDYCK